MYPDQVQRIKRLQEGGTPFTDAVAYRRRVAEAYVATRFRFREITPQEQAALEDWVLHGGQRPWNW